MALGIYIHIPYCIQRCSYCDFATYEQSKIMAPEQYVNLLFKEIHSRQNFFKPQPLDTIYFGGGTPSLLPAHLIVSIINELGRYGFTTRPDTEITIEINPATVDPKKLDIYLEAGLNRFSVGAQTFDDKLLKMVRREHSAKQTLETLELLRSRNLNFSFDILFALPGQTLDGLKKDVAIAIEQGAKHISPYCLTVPDGHPLSKGRAVDDEQVEMFEVIASELTTRGFQQYEISNFALPGYESRHNLLYWTDRPYWGIGLSAHSYSPEHKWGARFWNINSINEYEKQVIAQTGRLLTLESFPSEQIEFLEKHQTLTDFCHTSLRLMKGLSIPDLRLKFDSDIVYKVESLAKPLADKGLLEKLNDHWRLTAQGIVLSNKVFEVFTFLEEDL